MKRLNGFRGIPCLGALAILVFTVLLMPINLSAQSTALLTGTVVDTSGAVVPQASVICQNTQTGLKYTTTTTAAGIFRFPNLPIGDYELTVDHAGFQRLVRSGLTLLTGHSVDVRLQLSVGSARQSVNVTAASPVVQPTSSVIQDTITSTSVRDLPLNGRNPIQLVALIPGSISNGGAFNFQGVNSSYSVNGNRGTDNTYLLDGVSYTDPHFNIPTILPNPDALQEFTVKTSNFNASQQGSGANVQFSLRSGTNHFHGSAFEFLRNNHLDARNFFASDISQFKRNQFGGTFGGPIFKDKTFFFGSIQATRIRGGANPPIMVIPSMALRNGDFSSIGKTIIDPQTGQPFPNDIIPTNRMDSINLKLLETIPVPGQATGIAKVPTKPKTDQNDTQFSIKIDHNISSRDHLSGHWFHDDLSAELSPTPLPDYNASLVSTNDSIMASETHTFGPNLIFVGSFGYSRLPRSQVAEKPPYTMQELGAKAPVAEPEASSSIRVFLTGYSSLTNTGNLIVHPTVQQYRGRFTWMHSKHMIQFGADVTRSTEFAFTPAQGSGNWFYDGSISGDSFSDFLLGLPYLFRQQGASPQDIAGTEWAPWIEDNWKVSPRLTLNLGLRWDPETPPVDRYGPQTGFVAGMQSTVAPGAPLGLVYSGDPGLQKSMLPKDWNNVSPRVGFAYDVAGNGKTVVRGAYGIFYRPAELLNIVRFSSNTAAGRGLVIAFAPYNTADPYASYPSGDPFPAWKAPVTAQDFKNFVFPDPVSTSAFDTKTRSSYVQEWNLTVERQLTRDLGISLAYVGNHMVKGISSTEGNVALYGPGATAGNADSRRPYAGIASLQMVSPFEFDNYNALQITVKKHAGRGLNLLGNYTYQKCMDNNSGTIGGVSVINKLDPNKDYARCDFDLGQVANLSFEYDLPRVSAFRGFSDKALNHWEVTSIFTMHTGGSFSVRSGKRNSLSGATTNSGTNDLADQISANSARPAGVNQLAEWFNTAAYVPNALGTYGNSGRNSLFGPGFFGWDFGLMKHIPLTEWLNMEFRFEAFNFLNHTNFNNPNDTQSSSLFGEINSAGSPRVIQFAMKLDF